MTYQTDVTRGREIIERWCLLAEQRLDYLTELFETGRWRRFHSEAAFLDNIQEAKAAVETWRLQLNREALPVNFTVDQVRLERKPLPPRRNPLVHEEIRPKLPRSLQLVVDRTGAEAAAPVPPALAELAPAAVESRWEPVPDLAAVQQRYPLLRNAL
jgi:uncharacterized repeat protein (TIGR03809 family)